MCINANREMEGIEEKSNSKLPTGEATDDVKSALVLPSVDRDSGRDLTAKMTKLRENAIQKRKRIRRKSKKRKNPYAKSSWQQRRAEMLRQVSGGQQEMFATNGQPVAPYNTTQFLIEDHGDLESIDAQLNVARDQLPGGPLFSGKPGRARDSSFSVDSDEDYFYSSPEDEEEFLTKEFSNVYEDLNVERLSSMSKAEIIHDYLQLEAKYEKAVIELKRLRKGMGEEESFAQEESHKMDEEEDREDTDTSSKSENELAEQLRISQLENKSLKVELEELQKENKTLHNLIEKNRSSSSSVDSESDSSSSTSISNETSACDSDTDEIKSTNNNNSDNDSQRRTPSNDQMESVNQSECELGDSAAETNYSNCNGVNGSSAMSDGEGSETEDKSEVDK